MKLVLYFYINILKIYNIKNWQIKFTSFYIIVKNNDITYYSFIEILSILLHNNELLSLSTI